MIALLLALGAPVAHANGQTAHIWITLDAVDALPEGPLKALLEREDLQAALVNGAQFPDGGYAVGHGYGELAHWEPFQSHYLAWIRENHPQPLTDEGARHVAFLMGMASHGLADQVFDSLYVERSRVYDASHGWSQDGNFDGDSDVIYAGEAGAIALPEAWVPYDTLLDLYVNHTDQHPSRETLEQANRALRAAVLAVGSASENDTLIADKRAKWPWGGAHLADPATPGSPPDTAPVVAAYWADLWSQITGDVAPSPGILRRWPEDGAFEHGTDPATPESWASVAFGRGLAVEAVDLERLTWTDASGAAVPFSAGLFYGGNSHVLHLKPQEALAQPGTYTVRVEAGLVFTDGRVLAEPLSFTFHTDPAPLVDTADPEPQVHTCGCAGAGRGLPLVALAFVSAFLRRRR